MAKDDAVLIDVITEALHQHGDQLAVADRRLSLSYRELDQASSAEASALRSLLPTGDRLRVGIRAGNSVAYVVAYLAILKADGVPFLMDQASGNRETAAIQQDCGIDLLIHEEGTAPDTGTPCGTVAHLLLSRFGGRAGRPELDSETEVCRFTSGTTGRPCCIEFRGRAVARAAENWIEGTNLSGGDSILCFASLSNGLTFNTSFLSAFLVGTQLHLGSGLPTAATVSRMLTASAATRLVGFPALYESVVRRSAALEGEFRRLRMAISSAAPLRPETKQEFMDHTGVPLYNYFGTAETGPLTFATDPLTDPGLGKPLPGVWLRAGTPAQHEVIEARSESMGTRYLNAPGVLESRTTSDGYYRTGDVGYLEDGSLVLAGRTSQIINVGGRKIDAVEVAEVLRSAAGVADAVVLEVSDQHGSPALAAVLAASPQLDLAGPRQYLAERLASYKVPSLMRIVAEIPRGSTGKPALAVLRHMFETADGVR
jgi:acyl-CoA synthetase (AMP-forming)/AMP-acid ligase II